MDPKEEREQVRTWQGTTQPLFQLPPPPVSHCSAFPASRRNAQAGVTAKGEDHGQEGLPFLESSSIPLARWAPNLPPEILFLIQGNTYKANILCKLSAPNPMNGLLNECLKLFPLERSTVAGHKDSC